MSTKQNVRARSGLVQVRLLLIMFAISAIAAWLVAFPVAGRRQTANAAPPRLENPQETKQAEAFQKAGTEGDSSKSVYKKHQGSSLLSMRPIMAICMKASAERGDCS